MTTQSMRAASLALAALAIASTTGAQTLVDTPFGLSPAPPARPDQPLRLRFELVTEIPLAGPLPESVLRISDGRVEVAVAGGSVRTAWEPGAIPEAIDAGAVDPEDDDGWSHDPDGDFRARATSTGEVRTEKHCKRCRRNWKKCWKLKTPGPTIVAPLLTEKSLYFGAMDNRVYAVRKRNGHRLWDTDVGERVSKQLVLWTGVPGEAVDPEGLEPEPLRPETTADLDDGPREPATGIAEIEPTSLILVVSDVASQLLALEAGNGSEVAEFLLDEGGGRLVGTPLTTPGGEILIARQKYKPDEGGLMVFRLVKVADAPKKSADADDEESVGPPVPDAPGPTDVEHRKQPEPAPN